MADDIKSQLKLSQQLVMTPQLQMAIKMLQTPTSDLGTMLDRIAGLEPAHPGDPDLLQHANDEELSDQEERGIVPWSFDLAVTGSGDVCIFGEPPVARANRSVLPFVRVGPNADQDQQREARWFARALRQRAKTFEKFVATLLELRPALATGADFEPVKPRELAEAMGMHESTITRVAAGIRIETARGVLALASDKRGIHII